MTDLSRESVAKFRERYGYVKHTGGHMVPVGLEEFRALCDMALRCVSADTVRALAVATSAQADTEGDALQCWLEFRNAAAGDLREAARGEDVRESFGRDVVG